MARQHPGVVRLNKTPFSQQWQVVKVADDGVLITDVWTLHADDAASLDRLMEQEAER